MDSKSHSPAKNLQVDVDCASPAVAGDGSHSSGKASRLFLTSVFALLLLNFAGLSFAFWRLNEQNEELSQLQRIAAVQVCLSTVVQSLCGSFFSCSIVVLFFIFSTLCSLLSFRRRSPNRVLQRCSAAACPE